MPNSTKHKSTRQPPQGTLATALELGKQGYWIVPYRMIEGKKKPLIAEWQKRRLSAPEIREYLSDPEVMIGICLHKTAYIDIECDSKEAEQALRKLFRDAGCKIPKTVSFRSKRGKHRLYEQPESFPTDRAVERVDGIEIRGLSTVRGATSILPPSADREWLPGCSLFERKPATLPDAVVKLLLEKMRDRKPLVEPSRNGHIPEGERNQTLFRLGAKLGREGLPRQTIHAALNAVNRWACKPPLADKEIESIVLSTCRLVDTSKQSTVDPFPVDVYPPALAELVIATSKALPCPVDFVAVPMLSVLGTAIGRSCRVQVKEGWIESACIWSAVVGRPGDKKSPALEIAAHPAQTVQAKLFAEYESEQQEFDEAKSNDPETDIPPPIARQVITTDATFEALAELLRVNPRGLLLKQDELAGWTRGMNQYRRGKGNDRQNWLSTWSGSQIQVDRMSRKLTVEHPFICVTGCIQPDMLSELIDGRGREDGFIHRLLIAYPDTIPLHYSETVVSERLLQKYSDLALSLWCNRKDIPDTAKFSQQTLHFSAKCRHTWRQWNESHCTEINNIDPRFRGPWAKLEGYCARLALILHRCRYISGETRSINIDRESLIRAIKLVDYFKSHVARAYQRMKRDADKSRIGLALRWIREQGGTTSARDINRYKVAGVKDADEALQLLKDLEALNHGKLTKEARGKYTFTLTSP